MVLQKVYYLIALIAFICVVQSDQQYNYKVNGKPKHENVEINREENYLKIDVPSTGEDDEMMMIHDYNKGLTFTKMGGHCFLLSEFSGFSTSIDDWENADTEPFEVQGEITLNYKMVPYNLNRTSLPPVVQRQCSIIYMTVPGSTDLDTSEDANDYAKLNGTFAFPESVQSGKTRQRTKRGFWGMLGGWLVKIFISAAVGSLMG